MKIKHFWESLSRKKKVKKIEKKFASQNLRSALFVRKSVPNTFQTGLNTTDDDLGAIQTTVGDTTGKQQTLALPRLH